MKFDEFVILFHSFTIPSLNVSVYLVILIIGLVKSASKFTCSDFCIVFEPTNSGLLSTEQKFHNISLLYKTKQL